MHFAGPVALVYGLIRPVIWVGLLYVVLRSTYLTAPCRPMLICSTAGFVVTSTISAFILAGYNVGTLADVVNIAATPLLGTFVAGCAIASAKFAGFRESG